jgi:hypothetical protein
MEFIVKPEDKPYCVKCHMQMRTDGRRTLKNGERIPLFRCNKCRYRITHYSRKQEQPKPPLASEYLCCPKCRKKLTELADSLYQCGRCFLLISMHEMKKAKRVDPLTTLAQPSPMNLLELFCVICHGRCRRRSSYKGKPRFYCSTCNREFAGYTTAPRRPSRRAEAEVYCVKCHRRCRRCQPYKDKPRFGCSHCQVQFSGYTALRGKGRNNGPNNGPSRIHPARKADSNPYCIKDRARMRKGSRRIIAGETQQYYFCPICRAGYRNGPTMRKRTTGVERLLLNAELDEIVTDATRRVPEPLRPDAKNELALMILQDLATLHDLPKAVKVAVRRVRVAQASKFNHSFLDHSRNGYSPLRDRIAG